MERMTELTAEQGFTPFEETGDLPLQADLGDETLLVADHNGLHLTIGDERWFLSLEGKTQHFIEVAGRAVCSVLFNSPISNIAEAGALGFQDISDELNSL
jgi:hypothetical protein